MFVKIVRCFHLKADVALHGPHFNSCVANFFIIPEINGASFRIPVPTE